MTTSGNVYIGEGQGHKRQLVGLKQSSKKLDINEFQTSRATDTGMGDDDGGTADFTLLNEDGHVHITLETQDAAHDPYIQFAYRLVGESPALNQWTIGMDNSDTDTFKFHYSGAGTTPLTPSSTSGGGSVDAKATLSNAGDLYLANYGSATGKNYLIEESGVIKRRTRSVKFSTTSNSLGGRYSFVNTWYISNQTLGTSIAAADWSTSKFNYALYNSITAVTLTGWRWVGEFSSSVDYEVELWDVTVPSNGTSAASTAAKVGSTQSISATGYAIYTIGETGLTYSVAAGHQLYVVIRYTSGSGTKYSYGTTTLEFN